MSALHFSDQGFVNVLSLSKRSCREADSVFEVRGPGEN